MRFCKKIIAYVLVLAMIFALCFSMPIVSHAYTQGELIRDDASLNAWITWMDLNVQGSDIVDFKPSFWNVIDTCFSASGYGALDSYYGIETAESVWNGRMHRFDPLNILALAIFCLITTDADIPTAYIAYDPNYGVYRLREYHTDLWLVNSSGYFPYYEAPKTSDGSPSPDDITGIQWLPYEDAFKTQTNRHFVTKSVLDDMADYYEGLVLPHDKYYVITTTNPVSGGYLYLCDPHGYPFVNVIDSDSTAVDTPNNYYTDDDKTTTNFDQLINIEDGVVWFPTGETQWIDNLYYDESTHTYHVDSHDQYIIDSFNETYYTYNYTWEYNYYIDYTSITYVGQTEEYEDPYICYYELPDGRSSADLTASELEQLSMAFVDVINYARSADDLNQRVLYHFDGNTEDSSYWSYCTSFDWVEGASLTYMDEGTFNGSLYLDETAHDFVITLPNADTAGDFTFQFRYYQSYTAAPVSDSIITFGAVPLWTCNGEIFFDRNGNSVGEVPIGSWNEIAFVREGNILFYYLNGICTGNVSCPGSFGSTITFSFGSEQQTYKKLDEMRFTRAALYSGGADYTPTSVPHDTNLTLVLPDGEIPLADEYYTIVGSDKNLLKFDSADLSSYGIKNIDLDSYNLPYLDYSTAMNTIKSVFQPYKFYTFGNHVTLTQNDGSVGISVANANYPLADYTVGAYIGDYCASDSGGYFYRMPANALALCLSQDGYEVSNGENGLHNIAYTSNSVITSYTISVVDSAGNASYFSFTSAGRSNNKGYFKEISRQCTTFDFVLTGQFLNDAGNVVGGSRPPQFSFNYGSNAGGYFFGPLFLCIYPNSGAADIAYIELVVGTSPDFELEHHTAVYSSGQLENSPVLAVKSTTTVSGWQIGGVRPSYPVKGQVWALVENGRISSLQQYSGYAWLAVDGRIWTGTRWVPPNYFDVFTLQDFWDMQGITPKDEYTYIYTEPGFWDWWQKQWISFTGTLFDKMDDSGGGGGDPLPDLDEDPLINEEDKQKFDQNEYTGIVKLLRQSYGFVSEFFTGFTMGGIQSFLKDLTDSSSPIYGLFWMNGL